MTTITTTRMRPNNANLDAMRVEAARRPYRFRLVHYGSGDPILSVRLQSEIRIDDGPKVTCVDIFRLNFHLMTPPDRLTAPTSNTVHEWMIVLRLIPATDMLHWPAHDAYAVRAARCPCE